MSPTTPYNEQSLYNLYVKAFASAGFVSGIKAHLPRHILGYRQEKLGFVHEYLISLSKPDLQPDNLESIVNTPQNWDGHVGKPILTLMRPHF